MTQAPTGVLPAVAPGDDPLRSRRRLAALLAVAGFVVFVAGMSLDWWSVAGHTVQATAWRDLGFVVPGARGPESDPPGAAEAITSNGLLSAALALLVLLLLTWPRRGWARLLLGGVSGLAGLLLVLMTTTAGRRPGAGTGEYNRALVVTAVVWGLVLLLGCVFAARSSRTARAGLLAVAAALAAVGVLAAVLTTRAALADAGLPASLTAAPWLAVAGALLTGAGAVLLAVAERRQPVAVPAGAGRRSLVLVGSLVAAAVLVPYVVNWTVDRVDPAGQAADAVQQHVDAINARAVVRATTLLCADVRDDYPSAQVALALALLDGPPYADIDVGDARPTTVGGRDGFSVPLSLTVVADAATPVQLDVFVVDEYGWKLCSPELAGELGGTR